MKYESQEEQNQKRKNKNKWKAIEQTSVVGTV